jgi:hypothetical protein
MRAEQAKSDVPNRDAWLAKADHVLWKKTVIDFALGNRTDLEHLKGPEQCRLGKWLATLPASPWIEAIRAPHAEVHAQGIAAAKAFVEHRNDEGFAHNAKLDLASRRVVELLEQYLSAK